LGRAITEAVLDGGDQVVATARSTVAVSDLREAYGDAVTLATLDVTDAAAARVVVGTAVETYGRLDVVVNNAGYADSAAIEDTEDADFRGQIETNLFGVVNVTRAALPVLRRQRAGLFLQISSVGGRVGGTPGLAAYQSAKWAVEGFSEVLANEVAPLGIKVVIAEPGGFSTDWSGASMRIGPVSDDYRQTVGAMNDRWTRDNGRALGDPARAAAVLRAVSMLDRPPRRLLLGSDALDIALVSAEERMAEALAWAEYSRATDDGADTRHALAQPPTA
jgi:NAD(P)-dependent dehydrogenase (short-subunit alcohol dehydrogenase family)